MRISVGNVIRNRSLPEKYQTNLDKPLSTARYIAHEWLLTSVRAYMTRKIIGLREPLVADMARQPPFRIELHEVDTLFQNNIVDPWTSLGFLRSCTGWTGY